MHAHESIASLLIPIGLLLTGWVLMLLLARRNERKVRSEWEAWLRDEWEKRTSEVSENLFWRFCIFCEAIPPSWAMFSRRLALSSKVKIPGFIRFFYAVLFDFLPVHCWICFKLVLERNAKYRKDDMQHFSDEIVGPLWSTEVNWLPRPYCSQCFEVLGFEPHVGRKTHLKHKL